MRIHYFFALLLFFCVLVSLVACGNVGGKHGMKLGLSVEQPTVVGQKLATAAAAFPFSDGRVVHTKPTHAVDGTVDVVGTITARLNTLYNAFKTVCCSNCSTSSLCRKMCPGSCWVTDWKENPTISLAGFSIDAIEPAYFTPTAIVAQNYTNYSKKDPTSQTFQYAQSFSDTVTVSTTTTLSVSASVTASVKIMIASVSTTVGFSYSTAKTSSNTTTRTQQWTTTFGPITIDPCSGVYTECYILAATYNPRFTATYTVDGWANDMCTGNVYWVTIPLDQYYGDLCIACDSTHSACGHPPITFDDTIVTEGIWTGVFGTDVKCSTTPYPLPANECR